jgi:mannose-1-phosphate guanylyltransferase
VRALLLAAGLGTRLKPLTNYLPKCLVPIHGRPLIDYWLETLVNNGINEILINTHYLAPLVSAYISQSSWSKNVCIVNEENLLGTGGTILANRKFFQEKAFLVAHADNLTIFNPLAFIKCHGQRPSESSLTMMIFKTLDPKSCGIVEVDESGLVTSFHEKTKSPPGNLANGAVYILEPSVLDFMSSLHKIDIDFSTEIIPNFIGRINTYHNFLYHRDIGTKESWKLAHKEFSPVPASKFNEMAWGETLKTVDVRLQMTVNQLLG